MEPELIGIHGLYRRDGETEEEFKERARRYGDVECVIRRIIDLDPEDAIDLGTDEDFEHEFRG